jgi:hypothetical protein
MNRRTYLATAGALGASALAGCGGLLDDGPSEPPVVEDRPDAVYYPSHVEASSMYFHHVSVITPPLCSGIRLTRVSSSVSLIVE